MSILDLSFSILSLVLGLILLLYLTQKIAKPLIPLFYSIKEKTSKGIASRSKAILESLDKSLDTDNYYEAIEKITRAPIFDFVNSEQELKGIKDHNDNLTTRIAIIAEEKNVVLEELITLEKLNDERQELLSLLVKAKNSFSSIVVKRKESGKALPSWTKEDFEQRITEIKKELDRNKEDTINLFKIISKKLADNQVNEITYH